MHQHAKQLGLPSCKSAGATVSGVNHTEPTQIITEFELPAF